MSSTPSTPRPYLDEQGRTDAETYLMGCLDGSIVAGKKMKLLAKKMLPRIRNGHKDRWHFDVEKALRPVKFIEKFCRIPSAEKMGQSFIMEPYERMIVELAFGFVDDEGYREIREVIVEIGRKNGKAIDINTEIPTPDGWRLMRDIHPGDYVFGQDGKPSKVLVESEIFDKPMYLVAFDDGSEIRASEDHVWTVMNIDAGEWVDMTTEELAPHVNALDASGRQVEEWMVPLCKPIEYEYRFFPENPYEVGSRCALSGTPIPDEYLLGSVAQRRAMYDGVVDAIGDNTFGEYFMEFGTESSGFIKTLKELVASLGLKDISSPDALVCSVGPNGKLISSIERIPNEPSKCIAIDNESHLYLAGRGYTATHNTALLAAMNLYMLTSDGEKGAECYNGAVTTSQARLCYGATNDMVKMSPQLSKRIRRGMVQKRGVSGLNYDITNSYLVTISGRSDNLDGLNMHFGVLDELAAARNPEAYNLLKGSYGSRKQPMLFIISTQGKIRNNIWDSRLDYANKWLHDDIEDDRFLPILFEQDSREEVFGTNEQLYLKSNPGLGTVKSWDYLLDLVAQMKQNPADVPEVLMKQFNIPANTYSSFLTYEECVNKEPTPFDPALDRYCIVGFDTATTGDLNAAVAVYKRPGDDRIYERSTFWIAEEQISLNNVGYKERDAVPYHQWAADGWLHIVEGDKVNQMIIVEWLRSLVDEGLYPFAVCYDNWHCDDWTERELKRLCGEKRVHAVPQYAKVLSPLMKEHRLDLAAGRIINENPVTHWCRANVQVSIDNNNNVFPRKKGLDPHAKIDGYMAEIYAMEGLRRYAEEYASVIG